MKISRFKILNFISIILIDVFSIYVQYQEILIGMKDGMSIRSIMITFMQINIMPIIPIFFILMVLKIKYRNRKNIKHIMISSFGYSILLSIGLVGSFMIAFKNGFVYIAYISSLVIILMVHIIVKVLNYKNKTLE